MCDEGRLMRFGWGFCSVLGYGTSGMVWLCKGPECMRLVCEWVYLGVGLEFVMKWWPFA